MDISLSIAVQTVLKHEGGYTVDHAGPTNYGITLGAIIDMGDFDGDGHPDFDLDLDGVLTEKDIQSMTNAEATKFYKTLWEKWEFDVMAMNVDPEQPNHVAIKYFDLAVNMGLKQATKIVQRAFCAWGRPLVDDGIPGPHTKQTVRAFGDMKEVIYPIRSEAAGFYRYLAARNPRKYGKFLKGWLRRAYS